MDHSPLCPEDARATAILDAVAATLDRELPRWRMRSGRSAADGLPRDDRQALLALAREVFAGSPIPPGVFGFHPELLATATAEELSIAARGLSRRRRSVARTADRLRRLREHARRIQAIKRSACRPFASALRAAHEAGKSESFLSQLPASAPPFEDDVARRQFQRAFSPRRFHASNEVLRWIRRLGKSGHGATGRLLLSVRPAVVEFVCGPDAVCGGEPRCAVCELARRALCSGQAPAPAAELVVSPGSQDVRRAGSRVLPPAPARVRGENLVRRGARRVASLDANWLALSSRSPPTSSVARARWYRDVIAPESRVLGDMIGVVLRRLERGLRHIGEETRSDLPEDRLRVFEQAWRMVSRLRAIERARNEMRLRLLWHAPAGGTGEDPV